MSGPKDGNTKGAPDATENEQSPVPGSSNLVSILLPISSCPSSFAPLRPSNTITPLTMPPHRHSSTPRSHAPGPYKASIIVISSDEDEEPAPASKHGQRKPRRSKPEGEALEIVEDIPVELEEPETERLRQRCQELEQELNMSQKHLSTALNEIKANTKQNTLDVSALEDATSCEICTHPMWAPYLLTNCGHTFCQGCLTDWFNTTLGHHRQAAARGPPPYTCPSCRHPARTPPVQNFSLKRIVSLVAESRGESIPWRPLPPAPTQPPRGRGGARRDYHPGPFDGFFSRR
ncbi:hypothetical protein F5148DRAFT_1182284 [Russula earlei]|uniref:Uncharacterized protein n=1 Tax=Russula earlei TaxID=71964 RepID=A0ACC0UEC2_9AGAM|nr:hypothetical protein F5148DRAFT_1182284 [Russula earlei]